MKLEEVKATTNNTIWVEKYKPASLDDVLIEDHLKNKFKQFIENEDIPCLLFAGAPGNGKCVSYDTEVEIWVEDELYDRL